MIYQPARHAGARRRRFARQMAGAHAGPHSYPGPGPRPGPRPTPPVGSIHIPGVAEGFYDNLLHNNPIFQQMGANFDAAGVAAASQRRAYIQRLLADFGKVPEGFQDAYGDVDDLTRGLAQKATAAGTSQYGQLERARAENEGRLTDEMAARGILSSGETGYQIGKNQQEFQTSLSEAERALLDSLTGATTGYGQQVSDLAQQRAEAASQTMDQILATNPIPPSDKAKLLQQSIGGGHGWYGLDGQIYNQGGHELNLQDMLQKYLTKVRSQRAGGLHGDALRNRAAYRRLQLIRQYLGDNATTGGG